MVIPLLKSFMKYYKPYKKIMLLLLLVSCIRAGLELCFPYAVRQMLEQELPSKALNELLLWCGGLLILYIGQFAMQYAVSYCSLRLSSSMENDMRRDLFKHVQGMSFKFFDNNKSGNLISRLTSDLTEIGELASRGPNDIVICGLQMLGTMFMLLSMNKVLGAVVVVLLAFQAVHMIMVHKKMRQTFYANRAAQGEMTAAAAESINGARLVKAFTMEEANEKGFMAKADDFLKARCKSFRVRAYFAGTMMFFSNFINLAILVVGGVLINQGSLSFSDLVAFFLYVGVFMKPLMQLMGFSEMYQRGMAGYQRFYEVMEQQPDIVDAKDAEELKNCRGNISFENVSFGYNEDKMVLQNINLDIKAGETVAFVGATGAGKSTIANLLLRFYDVSRGKILVDGKDVRAYQQRELRKHIGLVQQDVFLFSDTVRHNIAYGKLGATDAEIERAAQAAAADGFIEELQAGYDTEIGERGVKLSGGQKQRLAIARAFLKNPEILVLDEATSALDNKTEQQIQRELNKLAQGRTTLVIAHRLSTIKNADKIVVLKNGTIAEMGTHQELLARGKEYYALYMAQEEVQPVKLAA